VRSKLRNCTLGHALEAVYAGCCFTEDKLHIGIFFFFFPFCLFSQMKARMTSSRHGLYKLGYTFATMKILEFGRHVDAIK